MHRLFHSMHTLDSCLDGDRQRFDGDRDILNSVNPLVADFPLDQLCLQKSVLVIWRLCLFRFLTSLHFYPFFNLPVTVKWALNSEGVGVEDAFLRWEMQTLPSAGLDTQHMKTQKEREVGEERAHPGCQPAFPRQREALMDLIDWREHREVWAELSADQSPALGRKPEIWSTQAKREPFHTHSQAGLKED